MSNAMKSTGKTVDEAVREALLRMGLRRDEVSVTVIQEARGGLLGFGRRDAVVEVAKKSEFDRDGRRRGGNNRRRGGDGGDEKRQETRGGRGGERRGGRRDEPREDGDNKGGDNKGGDRSRRGGRGRSRGRGRDEDTRQQPAAEVAGGPEPQAAQQDNRPSPTAQDSRRDEDGKDDGRRRRRRPRRRRKPSDQDESRDQQSAGATVAPNEDRAATENQPQPGPEPVVAVDAGAATDAVVANVSAGPRQEPAPAAAQVEDPASPSAPRGDDPVETSEVQESSAPARAADLPAAELVKPFNPEDAGDEVELLTRTATKLMVKAGFQSRVTVTPGDYHQVKMVVDDRSAGVLIGRQGSTVDAVEHLIDRIAARVAGERVKFNLDINNYRLRREDGLLGATRRAMTDARESGEPVAMEPAGGRERRIVHLEVAEDDDLVTYTEDGENGKFVVICRPDQVPAQHRDPELHGEALAAAEAPEEPRVDG